MSKMREQETSVSNHEAPCADAATLARWFAVYTTPRHEKHVSDMLTERRIETFMPLYRTTRQWKKSRPIALELPLFPTYVFVRIARQARGTVFGTPGVLSIVGSAREPWPLPDLEIEALRSGLSERKIEPHPYLVVGEKVRIMAGVMAGVEGVLVRKKNDLRVVLSLDTIMQSVAVEVDADDIEPVGASSTGIACEAQENSLPVPQSMGWRFGAVSSRPLWVPSN
jgi:transcription antitermination factor NusG